MSYYTWVNLQYSEFAEIQISELTDALGKHLDASGIHRDVIKDMTQLFTKQESSFKLYGGMIDEILVWVSAQRPEVPFGVQGRGEELRDVWVREYKGGQIAYSQGPFE